MEDPPRLFEAEEAPAALRTLLRQAQQDVASPAEVGQLVQLVESRLLAPTSAAPGFRPARGSRTTAKILAGALVAGLGLGGWFLVSRSRSSTPTAGQQLAKPQTPSAPVAPSAQAPAYADPAAPSEDRALAPTVPSAPRVAHSHNGGRDTVHRTSIATQAQADATERAPSDEFALLRAARQAISDHPERALALTNEHARLFPAGMLAQEREAIAVEALVKLGRASQAQARARTFLAAHPDSPYKGRIDAALVRISGAQRSP
jgi:hypothetical protein